MKLPVIAHEELADVFGGMRPWDASMSDGCTLSPDGSWRQACVTHDQAYYHGGSAADRKRADQQLRTDMIAQGAPKWVANAYYAGVRVGGVPGTGLPWEWGFGNHAKYR
jgi:hypothetical protein